MTVRGWLNTIDQSVKDNVYSFRVVELGQGAASALKARGGVGVITVQFREACAPDAKLSGRSVGGETEAASSSSTMPIAWASPRDRMGRLATQAASTAFRW